MRLTVEIRIDRVMHWPLSAWSWWSVLGSWAARTCVSFARCRTGRVPTRCSRGRCAATTRTCNRCARTRRGRPCTRRAAVHRRSGCRCRCRCCWPRRTVRRAAALEPRPATARRPARRSASAVRGPRIWAATCCRRSRPPRRPRRTASPDCWRPGCPAPGCTVPRLSRSDTVDWPARPPRRCCSAACRRPPTFAAVTKKRTNIFGKHFLQFWLFPTILCSDLSWCDVRTTVSRRTTPITRNQSTVN